MNVLAIDTAGPVAGVALWVDGVTSVRVERVTRGSDTRLMPWAQALAAEASIPLSALDGVAVGAGPGAFTGLRVGMAAALGLATALGCPVVPVSTLLSRVTPWLHEGATLCALDARKGRLYAATWRGREQGLAAGDLAPEVVLAELAPGFRAVGEGVLAYRGLVEAAGGVVVDPADDPGVAPLAALGAAALAAGEGRDPVSVQPTYLRPSDAKPRSSR